MIEKIARSEGVVKACIKNIKVTYAIFGVLTVNLCRKLNRVDWYRPVLTDISKDHNAFIFRVKAI